MKIFSARKSTNLIFKGLKASGWQLTHIVDCPLSLRAGGHTAIPAKHGEPDAHNIREDLAGKFLKSLKAREGVFFLFLLSESQVIRNTT